MLPPPLPFPLSHSHTLTPRYPKTNQKKDLPPTEQRLHVTGDAKAVVAALRKVCNLSIAKLRERERDSGGKFGRVWLSCFPSCWGV